MTPTLGAICGNRSAAQVLLYLEAYGAGYGKGIADTYEVAVSGIQRQLRRLESNGVLVSRMVGSSRRSSSRCATPRGVPRINQGHAPGEIAALVSQALGDRRGIEAKLAGGGTVSVLSRRLTESAARNRHARPDV